MQRKNINGTHIIQRQENSSAGKYEDVKAIIQFSEEFRPSTTIFRGQKIRNPGLS
jgi:hypothetical protein